MGDSFCTQESWHVCDFSSRALGGYTTPEEPGCRKRGLAISDVDDYVVVKLIWVLCCFCPSGTFVSESKQFSKHPWRPVNSFPLEGEGLCIHFLSSRLELFLIRCSKISILWFYWQVINARQNQLKNSGIPGDIFGLDDLLTIVSCLWCYVKCLQII